VRLLGTNKNTAGSLLHPVVTVGVMLFSDALLLLFPHFLPYDLILLAEL
jgi:hypothetical protein